MSSIRATIFALVLPLACATAQAQTTPTSGQGMPVEIVATASEYVPNTTTISHPGHAYTDCHGSTLYLGYFSGREDSNGRISGDASGTASTDTRCDTTFTPPTETSLTRYDRVNYTIAKSEHALYMLSCTQHWKPTKKNRALGVLIAGTVGSGEATDKLAQAPGTWTECPAFAIGGTYALSVQNTSDARLVSASAAKPIKLDYLSSAALPASTVKQAQSYQPQPIGSAGPARVHITSSPSGGEIYIDGKFFGNAPSDVTLSAGEHVVKVTLGGKEWTRTVQITGGEIQLRAELP
jgi:hypothetical protein